MTHIISKALHIRPGDKPVTAWAERSSGPGWSNTLLWVIVRDQSGKLREECLQPEEQSRAVFTLYDTAAALHKALMGGLDA